MIYIGIDLALRNTGVAVLFQGKIMALDTFKTASDISYIQACQELEENIQQFLDFPPPYHRNIRVIEIPAGSQSAKANIAAGCVTGVIARHYRPAEDILYTPNTIKKFIGHKEIKGTARKKLNLAKAYELYPDAGWEMRDGKPMAKEEHKADAVLLAHIASLGGL